MTATFHDASDAPAMTKSVGYWLNVVSHLDPRYGGLSTVVPQLGASINAQGQFSTGIAAFCAEGEHYAPASATPVSYWPASRAAWLRYSSLRDRSLRVRFREELGRADGIHIHGLWEQSTAIAASTARSLRKPYLISAHGMLEPWALANKKWKKRIYAALSERANVNGAACLHALTQAEARNYRDFGGNRPVAIIPNGVDIPATVDSTLFFEQFPALKKKKIILFLGRIHFKKGLDLLIESWAELARKWPEAHLVLAGPDFEGTRARIESLIAQHGIGNQVLFTGMISGDMKWSALAAAGCFVLPSYSEGLSVSVLEAMGTGTPVIVTTHCNLPEVEKAGAGWQIESDRSQLTYSIQECLGNSHAANQEIGGRGRRLVLERYSWPVVAAQMSELYRWIQGGPAPCTFESVTANPVTARVP